jgi:hypothetical protein
MNAALRSIADPSAVFTGTLPIGARIGQPPVNLSFSSAPYWRVALAQAWYDMTLTSSVGLYEFWSAFHYSAVVYDWCFDNLLTINPVTGNSYKTDMQTELKRLSRLKDQAGWPGGLGEAADALSPIPNNTMAYSALPDLNGHVANGSILGNHLAWGLALVEHTNPDTHQLWTAASDLVMGRYRDTIAWIAQGHSGAQNSNYYTFFDHWHCAGVILKTIGIADFLAPDYKYSLLSHIYNLRPDGRMFRMGDSTTDDYNPTQFRTMHALAAIYWKGDPEVGPLYAYTSMQDEIDYPVGTLTDRQGGTIKTTLWKEDVSPGIKALMFAAMPDQVKTAARAYAAGPHPNFSALPLAHYFPGHTNRTSVRTSWAMDMQARPAIAIMNGKTHLFEGHGHKNTGTWDMFYGGPLTGHFGVYQASNSVFSSGYNMNFDKQSSSMNSLIIADPLEVNSVRANAVADGGIAWPRPDREPDVYTVLRSNPDQPAYLSQVLDAQWGINGFQKAAFGAHWESPDGRLAYLFTDITLGYRTKQCDRANTVHRRMLTFATGVPTNPMIMVIADWIDAKLATTEKRWLVQAIAPIQTVTANKKYYWENTVRPGGTSFLTDENANPTAEGNYYFYRGPKYVGSFGGRCTVETVFPITGQVGEIINYPDSLSPGQGLHVDAVLKQGVVKSPSGTLVTYDPGLKGNLSPTNATTWPNGEDGHSRLEIKVSGIPSVDFLHVVQASDAGVAALPVTRLSVGNLIGIRFQKLTCLFGKSGVDIGAAGPGNYSAGSIVGAPASLFAAVYPGVWRVKANGVQVGPDITVEAARKSLYVEGVPPGPLVLMRVS